MYRQGDLLIKKVDNLPTNLVQVKNGVILKGEVTGHKHQLLDGELFKDNKGLMFLNILKSGKVVHEEHNSIELDKGYYAVIRQREYTAENMTKLVVD